MLFRASKKKKKKKKTHLGINLFENKGHVKLSSLVKKKLKIG